MTAARSQKLQALNDALLAAEKHLYALNIGVAARVEIAGGWLSWARSGSRWALWLIDEHSVTRHLLEMAPDVRVAAAIALPDLLIALRDEAAEDFAALDEATDAARAFARGEHA